jgi:hypothetical protein
MLESDGVIVMLTRTGAVTVSVMDPDTLPVMAVTSVLPIPVDAASPCEPFALLMVATDVDDEFQVTDVVRFSVELSEYVPVAINC